MVSLTKQWFKKVAVRALVLAMIFGVFAGNHMTQASTTCVRKTNADRAWVKHAYQRIAARPATNNEITYVAAQLANRAQYQDILTALAFSDSRLQAEVNIIFETFLGRKADSAALVYWSGYMKKTSVLQTTAKIASLPEYYSAQGGTDAAYIQGLYKDMLLRPASQSDITFWQGQLNKGVYRSTAALLISNTLEARLRKAERLYAFVMHTNPTSAERTYVAELIKGRGELKASQNLAVTDKFWNQAQTAAGLPTGTIPAACPKLTTTPPWKPPVGLNTSTLANHPNSSRRLIALTFDDGPNAYTPEVLNILKAEQVKATFFVLGTEANRRPATLRRMIAEGHTVANHTMSHPKLTSLSTQAQRDQIIGAQNVIDGILGAGKTKCMRAPYGSYNSTTLSIARERNLAHVGWSRDSLDWKKPGTSTIIANSTTTSRDGGRGILLLHDRSHTKDYLPSLIKTLKNQGYTFVSIC